MALETSMLGERKMQAQTRRQHPKAHQEKLPTEIQVTTHRSPESIRAATATLFLRYQQERKTARSTDGGLSNQAWAPFPPGISQS